MSISSDLNAVNATGPKPVWPPRVGGGDARADIAANKNKTPTKAPRTGHEHDTVSLSGKNKTVNLARGFELADEIRTADAKDGKAFAKRLSDAQSDIQRIGRLFGEVMRELGRAFAKPVKSFFAWWR